MASVCISVAELKQFLQPLVDWENVAIHLKKMEPHEIEKIKKNEEDIENKKMTLFSRWLAIYPDASWNDVIEALKKAGENSLAKNIEQSCSLSQSSLSENPQGAFKMIGPTNVPLRQQKVSKRNSQRYSLILKPENSTEDSLHGTLDLQTNGGELQLLQVHSKLVQFATHKTAALEKVRSASLDHSKANNIQMEMMKVEIEDLKLENKQLTKNLISNKYTDKIEKLEEQLTDERKTTKYFREETERLKEELKKKDEKIKKLKSQIARQSS